MRILIIATALLLGTAMSADARQNYRCFSSITGKWVSPSYAAKHRATTVCNRLVDKAWRRTEAKRRRVDAR